MISGGTHLGHADLRAQLSVHCSRVYNRYNKVQTAHLLE